MSDIGTIEGEARRACTVSAPRINGMRSGEAATAKAAGRRL
jgi:hypothetical protein